MHSNAMRPFLLVGLVVMLQVQSAGVSPKDSLVLARTCDSSPSPRVSRTGKMRTFPPFAPSRTKYPARKKHGYCSKSWFRTGLDELRRRIRTGGSALISGQKYAIRKRFRLGVA